MFLTIASNEDLCCFDHTTVFFIWDIIFFGCYEMNTVKWTSKNYLCQEWNKRFCWILYESLLLPGIPKLKLDPWGWSLWNLLFISDLFFPTDARYQDLPCVFFRRICLTDNAHWQILQANLQDLYIFKG